MAVLRFRERNVLERYLEMGGGYVLNFSDRTFAEFFSDFEVDINDPSYQQGHSGSKANRLRSFWESAPDSLVGAVLEELVNYAESYRGEHPDGDQCRTIAQRLQRSEQPAFDSAPSMGARAELPGSGSAAAITPRVKGPVEIFFSYAHEDERLMDIVRRQLAVRERLGQVVKWYDRMIPPGEAWRNKIDIRIEKAGIILLFMSPHFLESRYCYELEGKVALRRHREGSARVIPIVLRACDWMVTPFGELQALPRDGMPMSQWPDLDQASLDIVYAIMEGIQ